MTKRRPVGNVRYVRKRDMVSGTDGSAASDQNVVDAGPLGVRFTPRREGPACPRCGLRTAAAASPARSPGQTDPRFQAGWRLEMAARGWQQGCEAELHADAVRLFRQPRDKVRTPPLQGQGCEAELAQHCCAVDCTTVANATPSSL